MLWLAHVSNLSKAYALCPTSDYALSIREGVAFFQIIQTLSDEIKTRYNRNVVQAREFSDSLQSAMNSYHIRAISSQEIIDEMINIGHKLREAADRGEDLGLTDDEVCFYDALIQNDSARELMADDQLKVIATELVMTVRKNVSIDWTVRESARAQNRVIVKRILNKFGYAHDLQDTAPRLVLEGAEALSDEWAQ